MKRVTRAFSLIEVMMSSVLFLVTLAGVISAFRTSTGMFSHYEQTAGLSRLMFTHLPPTGTLRIYTASGQLVQQIKWNPSDLQRNCRATVNTTQCSDAGDLQWNMRTREDLEIGPGFYVFVVSTEVGGKKADKLGKFVIIR